MSSAEHNISINANDNAYDNANSNDHEQEQSKSTSVSVSVSSSDEICEFGPEFLVGSNDLIISKLVEFLPLSSLKTLRLVNRLWRDACKKVFRLKGHVLLEENEDLEIFLTAFELSPCALVNFRFPEDDRDTDPSTTTRTSSLNLASTSEDNPMIPRFLLTYSKEIRKLECSVDWRDFPKLVSQLQEMPHLDYLELLLHFDVDRLDLWLELDEEETEAALQKMKISHVKNLLHLSLSIDGWESQYQIRRGMGQRRESEQKGVEHIARCLTKTFMGVYKLTLPNDSFGNILAAFRPHIESEPRLRNLLVDYQGWMRMPVPTGAGEEVGERERELGPRSMQPLEKFRKLNLTTLHIFMNEVDLSPTFNLGEELKPFADSLEYVNLTFELERLRPTVRGLFTLPGAFPRLRTLKLNIGGGSLALDFEPMPDSDSKTREGDGDDERENPNPRPSRDSGTHRGWFHGFGSEMFPCLREFHFWTNGWIVFDRFWESLVTAERTRTATPTPTSSSSSSQFVPGRGSGVVAVVEDLGYMKRLVPVLSSLYRLGFQYTEYGSERMLERVGKMFPNVVWFHDGDEEESNWTEFQNKVLPVSVPVPMPGSDASDPGADLSSKDL